MKTYKTEEEIKKDVVNGILEINGDVNFECSFSLNISLKIEGNIDARDINAWNIDARDINAWNIDARNINAWNINARDINAWNINAWNINAWDINAGNINAWNIQFYAVCFAYVKLVCRSIVGRRDKSKFFCLDSEVIVKNEGNKL
jgi:hypothetical protein